MTKKYKRLSHLFLFLSTMCTVLPLLIFIIYALTKASDIQRYVLVAILIGSVILGICSFIRKQSCRTIAWLMFVGVCYVGDHVLTLSLVMLGVVILDEFVFQPLHKHYKNLAIINHEIDKRTEA